MADSKLPSQMDPDELAALAADGLESRIREIAREEIASLAGLVLRRSQEASFSRLEERNIADAAVREHLAEIFGEVLRDFGGTHADPG